MINDFQLKFVLVLTLALGLLGWKNCSAQNAGPREWSIGFRFGDPTGIQLMRKVGDDQRLELNVGRYFNFNRFDFSKFIYDQSPFLLSDDVSLEKYQLNRGLLAQANFHLVSPIDSAAGIRLYYGGGIQFRRIFVEYQYRNQSRGNNIGTLVRRELEKSDYGMNGLLGIEKGLANQPVTLFLDGGIFLALNDEFRPWLQFGAGLRYHFN